MKKIILTGGGTAGHITPNIALIPKLRQAGFFVNYIGLRGGMEEKLIIDKRIPFYGISGGKLRRYMDFKNITDLFRISAGFFEAVRIIKKINPDVIFSKGGFVSTPVVWAGRFSGVPVIIHESDMTIGLANRLSIPFVKKVCYTFPETQNYVSGGKGVFTGLPIREELLRGSADRGRNLCGFNNEKPVVVAVGGSQGSEFINHMIRDSLDGLLKTFQICHICGKGNVAKEFDTVPGYCQFEYITKEQPDIYAMADVMVTRGGATSLFEILALNKPNLIIPYSRKASRGDQIINAESFRKQGFSEVLEEEGMTSSSFQNKLIEVYNNKNKYVKQMRLSDVSNGLENVFRVICDVSGVFPR